jgi:hypothetical protein
MAWFGFGSLDIEHAGAALSPIPFGFVLIYPRDRTVERACSVSLLVG